MTCEKVLREFGRDPKKSRRAYREFVSAGVGQAPASPFACAYRGVLVGSEAFVERIRKMLGDREADSAVAELARLRGKPTLETIRDVVAEEYGVDGSDWARGRRSDSVSRAVAAYPARREFSYRSKDVAVALGYSSTGGVGQAIARVEAAGPRCGKTIQELARRLTNG